MQQLYDVYKLYVIIYIVCMSKIDGSLAEIKDAPFTQWNPDTETQDQIHDENAIATVTWAGDHEGRLPETGKSFGNFPHGFDNYEEIFEDQLGPREGAMFCPGKLYKARNPETSSYDSKFTTYQYFNLDSPFKGTRTFPIFQGKIEDSPLKTGNVRISYVKSGNFGPDNRIGRILS